eukprot:TRINITY_DN83815_c0_g1_i1.p1 TRINITY_DN83815_c0_g1~~TRINITY_DN83815_c0_g1_i1.p1  ORF type:complete len:157 (-),score=27.84 TRINITY_DN83815_c0_g1_i1:142-612(-)
MALADPKRMPVGAAGKVLETQSPRFPRAQGFFQQPLQEAYQTRQVLRDTRFLVSLFKRVDLDCDGLIDRREFMTFMKDADTSHFFRKFFDLQPHEVQHAFEVFDGNGDGFITLQEWKRTSHLLAMKARDGTASTPIRTWNKGAVKISEKGRVGQQS